MFVEVSGAGKHTVTLVTHEVVLLAVSSHVNIESVGVSKHFATNVTSLQPLSYNITWLQNYVKKLATLPV